MLVLAEVGRAVEAACASIGARWYLFGAQAAMLRGLVRATEDIDVTVELGSATTEALVAALEREGLTLRVRDAAEFIRATRVLPLSHVQSATPVDVVLGGSGFEERFLESAEAIAIDGVTLRVPIVEHLVAMKILAGRAKDLEDAVALLVANPAHDRERIRSVLADLEAALDQSDLLPQLEAALARAARAKQR